MRSGAFVLRARRQICTVSPVLGETPISAGMNQGGKVIDLQTRATYPEGSFVTAEPHLNLAPVLKMGSSSQFRYG